MQDYKPTPEDIRERVAWLAIQEQRRQEQRRAILASGAHMKAGMDAACLEIRRRRELGHA